MLRVQFEEDLEKLHNQFYAMGKEVLSQINRTVRAFVTHDRDLAKEVIEDDAEVNEYEVKLEKKSLEIIALQQPVSQDLRTVITVLKASSDLERMGEKSVDNLLNAIEKSKESMVEDIIITIRKEPSMNILKKIKNYEFRKYIPKTGIKRIWVYTGMPVGKMEYMIEIDKIIKYPEKIEEDGIRKY